MTWNVLVASMTPLNAPLRGSITPEMVPVKAAPFTNTEIVPVARPESGLVSVNSPIEVALPTTANSGMRTPA